MVITRLPVALTLALSLLTATVAVAQDAPPRLPAPDDAARREAAALIEDVYRAELAAARESLAMAALAQRLDAVALDTRDDPAAAWVLWQRACDLATRAGDPHVTLAAIDHFAGRFDVDRLALTTDALKLIAVAEELPPEPERMINICHRAADDAVRQDRYDAADRLAEIAAAVAERVGRDHLKRRAADKLTDLAEARAAYEEVQPAYLRLTETPSDPEANLALGKYHCLIKGDWDRGLPLLARGGDLALADAAQKDLGAKADANLQVAAADTWWSLAEKESTLARRHMQSRAAALYGEASSRLTGFARDRADTRVRQLQQQQAAQYTAPPDLPGAPGTPEALAPLPPESEAIGNDVRVTDLKPASSKLGHGELLIGGTPGFPETILRIDGRDTREYLCVPATSQLIYDVPQGARRFTALGTAATPEDPRATRFRFAIVTNRGKTLVRTDELTTYPAACVDIDVEVPDDTRSIALVTESLSRRAQPAAIWVKPRFVVDDGPALAPQP